MDKKDKRNIEISWGFVVFALVLGFFMNIVSSAVFDMYVNGFRPRVVTLFAGFLVLMFLVISFLSFVFKNTDKFKEESLKKLLVEYIKSWRGSSKKSED